MNYFEMQPKLNTDIRGYDLPKSVHCSIHLKNKYKNNTLESTVIRSRGMKKLY